MPTLEFKVSGQHIERVDNVQPVAKSREYIDAHFEFLTPEWAGIKTAIFSSGNGAIRQPLDDNGNCVVPWEFWDTDRDLTGYVSVFCGDLVTADRAPVRMYQSGYQETDESREPTPDEYKQMVERVEAITKECNELLTKLGKKVDSNYETLDAKKANIANPVFSGSVSMGRKEESAVGESSTAVGVDNVASGKAAYAEGSQTQATGKYGHAEGWGTEAAGESSHAEGNSTKATGMEAHAEGALTQASGNRAHAEGHHTSALGEHSHAEGLFTSAKATNSHAEGVYTTATGDHSHAEGLSAKATGHTAHAEGNNTEAAGTNQHVQGKYNVVDTEGKYAHIVGNGTDDEHRSNAHTVDWNGNGWFAGKVSQEGTPTEDEDLATKKYVDDINLSAGSGTKSIQQATNGNATIPVQTKNPNAYALDNALADTPVGASGESASVFGGAAAALGKRSSAKGTSTVAKGKYSSAEGDNSVALGSAAHAEGSVTTASGNGSHAEGQTTKAVGASSHAEGVATEAQGNGRIISRRRASDSNRGCWKPCRR